MNQTSRRRVLVPILMPITVLGAILLFSGSLSRILLAVDAGVSVLVAVVAAGYVMAMAFVIEKNPAISARALGAGMVLGIVGLAGAGLIAQSVGVREVHAEEEGGDAVAAGAEGVAIPPDALVWEADSGLAYVSAPSSGTGGTVTVALDNTGGLEHNVVFEGVRGDEPLVAAASAVDVATVDIPAGDYTYYCSIPGHRAAGMEGQISLS